MCSFRFKDDYSFTLYQEPAPPKTTMREVNTIADIFPAISKLPQKEAAQLLLEATIKELSWFTDDKLQNQCFYDLNDQSHLQRQICSRLNCVLEIRRDLKREVESMKNVIYGGVDYIHYNLTQLKESQLENGPACDIPFQVHSLVYNEKKEYHGNYDILEEKMEKELQALSTQSVFRVSRRAKLAIIQTLLVIALTGYFFFTSI